MAWHDEYAPTCPACRDIYAARTPPGTPPCATCRVGLDPANEEAATVYLLARHQVRLGPNGHPISLDIPAVLACIDLVGVGDRLACLTAVLRCYHEEATRAR